MISEIADNLIKCVLILMLTESQVSSCQMRTSGNT